MLNEYVENMLSTYFSTLAIKGYYKYSEVYKMLYIIILYRIIMEFGEELTPEDIALIKKRFTCITGTDCLFPIPCMCEDCGDCKSEPPEPECHPTDQQIKDCEAQGTQYYFNMTECGCDVCKEFAELSKKCDDLAREGDHCYCKKCNDAARYACESQGLEIDEQCNCVKK